MEDRNATSTARAFVLGVDPADALEAGLVDVLARRLPLARLSSELQALLVEADTQASARAAHLIHIRDVVRAIASPNMPWADGEATIPGIAEVITYFENIPTHGSNRVMSPSGDILGYLVRSHGETYVARPGLGKVEIRQNLRGEVECVGPDGSVLSGLDPDTAPLYFEEVES